MIDPPLQEGAGLQLGLHTADQSDASRLHVCTERVRVTNTRQVSREAAAGQPPENTGKT